MRQLTLDERSLTELRGIAQSVGVSFDFSTDRKHLIQAIQQQSVSLIPKPIEELPHIAEPESLRTIPPTKNISRETMLTILKPFTDRGLVVSFDGDVWTMRAGKNMDSGNIRTSLRVIVQCAERVMR